MKKINITDEPYQKFNIPYEDYEIEMQVRFLPVMAFWTFSIEFNGKVVQFKKLSLGVFHLESNNLPFDFIVEADNGIDPYLIDDFTSRCKLLMVERADIETIKGVSLP